MTRNGVLALAAASGCLLLALVAPRAHPAGQWRIQSDREESQVRAREISSALGVDTTGWTGTVAGSTDSKAGYQIEQNPGIAEERRFSPVFPKVALQAPTGNARVLVKLSAAGEFNRWEWKGYPKAKAIDDAASRAIAQTALAQAMGKDAAAFQPAAEPTRGGDGLVFAFERSAPLAERFEATIDAGRLVKAEVTPAYPRNSGSMEISTNINTATGVVTSTSTTRNDRKKYIDVFTGAVGVGIDFLGGVLAACVYIFWAVRRAVKHRFVLAFSATCILWGAVYWANWMGFDQRYDSVAGGDTITENFLGAVAALVGLLIVYIIFMGATDAIGLRPKLVALRSLFSSSSLNRHSGGSILAGLALGPLVTALPLAVSSLRLLGSQQTGDYEASLVYSAHPFVQVFDLLPSLALLGLFGFGTGFLARYVRKKWLSLGLLAVLGTLLLCTVAVPSETLPVAFLTNGALLFLLYYQLFLRVDLLAVLTAGWCGQVLWNVCVLTLQPAASLRNSAIGALVILAGAVGCAMLVTWRGRELSLDEDTAPAVVTSRRESLMREFSIAHRVQQQMLPSEPPRIPGCSVAASCEPAQDVGGDLFEFLRLPDGRWSIGVGDVSGKGVPAALYMTLTKGLLIATTQDSSDLVDIIGHVNHHIYAATERKTFVTMALGAYDPETRLFDHVRAGHNPIVWRRPAEDSTSLLNAPGLGLGIVSDRLFRRGMKLDRLQLSSGDALVFYSDGVTEAMNVDKEQFGEERLMQAVQESDGLEAGAVRQRIVDRVKEFLAGIAPQDDMTVVVLRVH
ncbi:MAG TPA: PP2C family protein-serine/threonine phosphatase [Candidatus Sulfopaludibacter sp.]|nr:PP2C family protein-serine/threonine phosphatase [Candidatus Sulfopaludibacter sp.]